MTEESDRASDKTHVRAAKTPETTGESPAAELETEATWARSHAPPAEFVPGDRFAGFVIEREIGRGKMGIVYRATRVSLDRVEALKIMTPAWFDDPEIRTRFKLEARHAAIASHPHVVTVYDAEERDGRLYIAMEYIGGTDLRARIASDGAVPPADAAEITRQVASALDAAHSVGVIHRDVKPANILLAGERGSERAYLTDFGVSRRSDDPIDLTAHGSTVGTPHYTAPEAYRSRPVDKRADVYSLGCVLFEMLSGRKPFPGTSSTEVAIAHVNEPPPQVDQVGGPALHAFDAVIRKAMAKDPAQRYQSAGDLGAAAVAAAQRTADGETVSPSGSPDPGAARRWIGRYRWALLAGLVCVAVGIAAWLALSTSSPSLRDRFGAAATPVPTNRVTGSGTVTVQLRGDLATVTVDAHGLVDQLHWMHIHAGGQLGCPTASAATVTNGHLYVSAADGDKSYGPPVTSLRTVGDTSAQNHLALTGYPVGGTVRYERTITVPAYVARYISEGDAFVVVHGIDYNHNGVYDNSLGTGGEKGAPALCGNLGTAKTAAAGPKSSHTTVYTASLTPLSTLQAIAILSVCHGSGATTAPLRTSAESSFRSST
jgi:serine/threonine-protein kinase